MHILIAEDERVTRTTLQRQLERWGHTVTSTEDGQQAWDAFDKSDRCDILITDWEMPNLPGPDLVRRIRQAARPYYTYIIMLTSRSDKADVVSGIEAGADDFVSKPFDREELRVRLLAGERIVTLEHALSRQNAQLRQANDRIRHGLQAAARVQQSMLPRTNVTTPRVSTAWTYVPTDELAGDAIGLCMLDDRYLVSYVLDVSGHGVPAALLSVSAMHALEPVPAESSLLRDLTHSAPSSLDLGTVRRPALVATELNRRFRAGEIDGRFLTMILTVLDTHTGRLHIARAGHPPPLVLHGREPVPVPDDGSFPIAVVDDAEYEDSSVELSPGDRVCLVSDGILEQISATIDEEFGADRLQQTLQAASAIPTQQAADSVVTALSTWAGGRVFRDDVSLVLIDWHGA